MKIIQFIFVVIFTFGCQSTNTSTKDTAKKDINKQPNILFLAIDDLRPELGCYGSEVAITPNMDALAKEGLLFKRAYCQQPICSPSRASLMTGARPETIGIIENFAYFRDKNPDIVTLPQHFRANGYETVHSGKIYHKPAFADLEKSWSREPAKDKVKYEEPKLPGGYALPENVELFKKNRAEMLEKYGDVSRYGLGKGPAYEMADVSDQTYEDGYNVELAIATLHDMVEKGDKPFFLGMGFKLPHLDWKAPKKYWDMYDRGKIPMASQTEAPKDGAAMGLHPSFELRARQGIPKMGPIEGELARTLKHGYLASVTYVDALVGKMIAALEEAGVRDNTIILLWSDHGWHIGDMGIWGKATNYEVATRVPMMISTPNMPEENRGKTTDALVELIDMYPTLCELAGLAMPSHLEGQSFAPLLENPERQWKTAAFSQYPNPALREWAANPLSREMRETYFGPLIEEVEAKIMEQQGEKWDKDLFENNLMGYAMRTENYRLVVWKDRTQPEKAPIDIELYDHQTDPKETVNIADNQPELVAELMVQFDKGWKGNMAQD